MTTTSKAVRCAIYTRVSTDSGLDQEFNSLDAQYDAASAYIRSQAHAHWTLVRTRYDDGGFSGGSTNRPALQRLLADVKARRVNVIVVYKVDRLTRSLADFAKLVEQFDAHGVSFVSVTQQFNTTTSMGRLTLNVLLSFAQFEREVTSERIRDKIGASKRKGLWVGGMVPLGYELKDGKLLIVDEEAAQVRTIFRRYLELGSVNRLVVDLRERNFRTKIRKLSTGGTRGGVAFTQGPLFYMLRSCFYVGEVRYKNEIYPGPQPPLMARELFEAVQAKLTEQWSHRTVTRNKSASLLSGLLFDDAGHPMVPTHATKNKVRYRYYVSQPHLRGPAKPAFGLSRTRACHGHRSRRDQGACAASRRSEQVDSGPKSNRSRYRRSKRRSHRGSQESVGGLAQAAGRGWSYGFRSRLRARSAGIKQRRERLLAADPVVQTAIEKVSRDPAATVCLTSQSPSH